ncbi:hypothetical protein BJX76DRAFT_369125 [Aspergillus varians]
MSPLKDYSSPPGKEPAPTTPSIPRSKSMPTDSPTAKFLYAIIKQLDLKGIDWSLVASQLEISNGHAARMRYHRFRKQMEGINTTQRKKQANKSSKLSTNPYKAGLQKEVSPEPTQVVKNEPPTDSLSEQKSNIKPELDAEQKPNIKDDPYPEQTSTIADIPQYESQMMSGSYPHASAFPPSIANPYPCMSLAPKLRMYSPTPDYPPVPNTFEEEYPFPIEWTPVKVESWARTEEHKDTEMAEAPIKEVKVKEEEISEQSTDRKE